MQINEKALKNCPFCGKAMMLRCALWPSEGDTDSVIHAEPTDCPMYDFCDGTADGSIAEKWNRRALTTATPPDVAKIADAIEACDWSNVSIGNKAILRQAATALRLSAGGGWREPVAYRVHDFHVARMPVKAKGKFEPPTEYLYPANRAEDAKETARIMGATCTPLYTLPASLTVEAGR